MRILPLINDVPNPVERDAYRQQVARVLQVDESAFLQLTTQKARPRRRLNREELRGSESGTSKNLQMQMHRTKLPQWKNRCWLILLDDPEKIYRINRWLQKEALERLSAGRFFLTRNTARLLKLSLNPLPKMNLTRRFLFRKILPDDLDFILEKPA